MPADFSTLTGFAHFLPGFVAQWIALRLHAYLLPCLIARSIASVGFSGFYDALIAGSLAFMRFAGFLAGFTAWMYTQAPAFSTDAVVVSPVAIGAVKISNRRLPCPASLPPTETGADSL